MVSEDKRYATIPFEPKVLRIEEEAAALTEPREKCAPDGTGTFRRQVPKVPVPSDA
jgi:hypothetical protein